jgi:AcrR family transcriptional regulator
VEAGAHPRGRDDILKAAAREFGAKGFLGATTASIARAAGVTQPLVHHHFGSKIGLWHAVLEDLFGELRALQEGTIRDLRGIELSAWLRILLRQFVLFSARRNELARIMVSEGAPSKGLDATLEAWVRPQMEQLEAFLTELFKEWKVSYSEREIRLLCFLVLGACTHPFLVAGSASRVFGIDVGNIDVAQEYADLVVRTLFGALKAEAAEQRRTTSVTTETETSAKTGRERRRKSAGNRSAAAARARPHT